MLAVRVFPPAYLLTFVQLNVRHCVSLHKREQWLKLLGRGVRQEAGGEGRGGER